MTCESCNASLIGALVMAFCAMMSMSISISMTRTDAFHLQAPIISTAARKPSSNMAGKRTKSASCYISNGSLQNQEEILIETIARGNEALTSYQQSSTSTRSTDTGRIGDGTGSTLLMERRKMMSSCAKSIFQVGSMAAILTPFCADASTDIGVDEYDKTMATAAAVPVPLSVDVKTLETDVYEMCFQRKPNDYNAQERERIESLIDNIVLLSRGTNTWDQNLLPGTWRVAYIRPGEGGGGLDRRIPFPELPFNQSYQRFTLDTVTNIGELLGPNVRVEVKGSLREENIGSTQVPKRLRALFTGGESELYAGSLSAKLPIEGEGIFDGVFLGEKIRIGQNLNGGGALVVQVRVVV